MPCRSDYPSDYDTRIRRDLDRATRVACELSNYIPSNIRLSSEARRWITEHEEADRRRIEAAQKKKADDLKRKSALAKLTSEEAKLLGVKKV